ncbi:hypothetical protein [Actinoplanes sp. NPDC020271]|uniref:hypothetical protein n=1 Tax=Actinoplanes sp. NPDC020271 TaxID=3363896 RepID=UPI003796B85D
MRHRLRAALTRIVAAGSGIAAAELFAAAARTGAGSLVAGTGEQGDGATGRHTIAVTVG